MSHPRHPSGRMRRQPSGSPVDKQALLAAERRLSRAPAYSRSERVFVLAYPNTYHVGMSNLGFLVVRRMVEATPGWRCERLFDDECCGSTPRTLESSLRPAEAGVLAFSVSTEVDVPAIPRMLYAAGVPILAASRDERDPVVLVGGAAPSLNPEPLADIADLVAVGEAEELLPQLLERLGGGADRRASLEAAATVPGVYVPRLYETAADPHGIVTPVSGPSLPVRRAVCSSLDRYPTASDIVTPNTEFADTRLIEIARGCSRGCRFCIVHASMGPARHRSAESVFELARGERRIGLVGAAAADHPDLLRVVSGLVEAGHEVTLSASRTDALGQEVLDALAAAGQRSLTVAPESPVQEIGGRIGKTVALEQVIAVARGAQSAGFRALRLYFMIGLPGSPADEADRIVSFALAVGAEARALRVAACVGPFVPKPHTAMEREPLADADYLRRTLKRVERELGRSRTNVEARIGSVRQALVEALVSRGDRRTGRALAAMAAAGRRAHGDLSDFLREQGVDPEFVLHGPWESVQRPPWHVVACGSSRTTRPLVRAAT